MYRLLKSAVFAAVLAAPLTLAPAALRADDDHKDNARTYHDEKFRDDHTWNDKEDRAYRAWAKENHRKYRDFAKISQPDQQKYWEWRHDHSDAVLKLDIR